MRIIALTAVIALLAGTIAACGPSQDQLDASETAKRDIANIRALRAARRNQEMIRDASYTGPDATQRKIEQELRWAREDAADRDQITELEKKIIR